MAGWSASLPLTDIRSLPWVLLFFYKGTMHHGSEMWAITRSQTDHRNTVLRRWVHGRSWHVTSSFEIGVNQAALTRTVTVAALQKNAGFYSQSHFTVRTSTALGSELPPWRLRTAVAWALGYFSFDSEAGTGKLQELYKQKQLNSIIYTNLLRWKQFTHPNNVLLLFCFLLWVDGT